MDNILIVLVSLMALYFISINKVIRKSLTTERREPDDKKKTPEFLIKKEGE